MGDSGAVTIVQRFGSALNLNVHFHTLLTAGRFVAGPGPSGGIEFVGDEKAIDTEDRLALETTIGQAIVRRLESEGAIEEGAIVFEDLEDSALGVSDASSVSGRIAFGPSRGSRIEREGAIFSAGEGSLSRRSHGFDLFLDRPVTDRGQLERLCRYLARPPVPASRLSWREDGRLRLELPRAWSDGTQALVFDPLDFISRLAAIVPRPRVNQIRYHGILAPNAAWRSLVLPTDGRLLRRRCHGTPTRGRWIRWAELMKRVFEQDVLRCDSCGGRREVIALIRERSVIEAILDSLDLPSTPPAVKPSC